LFLSTTGTVPLVSIVYNIKIFRYNLNILFPGGYGIRPYLTS